MYLLLHSFFFFKSFFPFFLNHLFFFFNSVFFVFSLHLIFLIIFLFIVFVFSFKCFMSLIYICMFPLLFLCFKKQQRQCSGYFPFSSLPFAPFYLHFVSILPPLSRFISTQSIEKWLTRQFIHNHFRSDAISVPYCLCVNSDKTERLNQSTSYHHIRKVKYTNIQRHYKLAKGLKADFCNKSSEHKRSRIYHPLEFCGVK